MSGGESNPAAIRGRYGHKGTTKSIGWRQWKKWQRGLMSGPKRKRHKKCKPVTEPADAER
jgi:hypothetical protein